MTQQRSNWDDPLIKKYFRQAQLGLLFMACYVIYYLQTNPGATLQSFYQDRLLHAFERKKGSDRVGGVSAFVSKFGTFIAESIADVEVVAQRILVDGDLVGVINVGPVTHWRACTAPRPRARERLTVD